MTTTIADHRGYIPTHTNALSLYRHSGAMRDGVTPANALAYIDENPGDVLLMLGRFNRDTRSREMVTEDDLRRWVAEEEQAAQWADVEAGERAMAEMGVLR